MQKWILENPKIQDTTIYVPTDGPELTERTRRTYIEISKAQQYFQRNPIKFVETFFGFYLLDFQKLLFMKAWITPNVLCNCTRGAGKALDEDTKILTDKGIKKLKDIQVGDCIYNLQGELIPVVSIGETIEDTAFQLTFDDLSTITAHPEHEWKVYVDGIPRILETQDLVKYGLPNDDLVMADSSKWGPKLEVDIHDPLNGPTCEILPMDPYMVGLFLGNQNRIRNSILINNEDVQELCNYCNEKQYAAFPIDENGKSRVYIYTETGTPFDAALRYYCQEGYSLPPCFIRANKEDRLSLFYGLIDGENTGFDKEAHLYVLKDRIQDEFFFQIQDLLTTLGIKHSYRLESDRYVFTYYISQAQYHGKFQRLKDTFVEHDQTSFHRKRIIRIRKTGPRKMRCIQVGDKSGLYLAGPGLIPTHNSTIISILLMAKGMLFNNYWSYIASGSGNQAQQTFRTLEQLANDNIETFMNSSGYIFKQELDQPQGINDGFTHSPTGHKYELYNGSSTRTLNSSVDKNRGNRGNVIFDECGWLAANMINVYKAYAVVNKDLKTGLDAHGRQLDAVYAKAIPEELPYQVFYISSASDEESEYYSIYREFAKRMFMGDRDYFVYQVDCEVCFHPTLDGVPTKPLLSPEFVENQLKTNPEKAKREYYCQFSTDAGEEAIIRRSVITRNSITRRPLLSNDTGEKKFILAYDPARMTDNSVIAVAEIYQGEHGWQARLVNCINMMDYSKKKATPKRIDAQVDILREVILDYNKGGNKQYSNIIGIYIDGGSGGQAQSIADSLIKDWRDKDGELHFGLADLDHDPAAKRDNPNVITDKLHYMEPTKFKPLIYDALIDMVHSDLIEFTAEYENRGYLLDTDKNGNVKKLDLTKGEELALVNLDLMKDQIVNIERIRTPSGRDKFQLSADKSRRMHDDHAYVLALLGYGLYTYRRDNEKAKNKQASNVLDILASSIQVSRRKTGF